MACCEYYNLKFVSQVSQKLLRIWSDIDPCLNKLPRGELDRKFYVVRRVEVLIAVDQCFVKIEYDGLLIFVVKFVPLWLGCFTKLSGFTSGALFLEY